MQVFNRLYLFKYPGSEIIIGNNLLFSSGGTFNPLCRNICGCIYAPVGSVIVINSTNDN